MTSRARLKVQPSPDFEEVGDDNLRRVAGVEKGDQEVFYLFVKREKMEKASGTSVVTE